MVERVAWCHEPTTNGVDAMTTNDPCVYVNVKGGFEDFLDTLNDAQRDMFRQVVDLACESLNDEDAMLAIYSSAN